MHYLIAAIVITLPFVAIPAKARETNTNLFKLSLAELIKIEITGPTLTPESIKTTPAAVTVFTYEHLKNLGLNNVSELMSLVPGFQSYRSSQSSTHHPFSSRGRRIGSASAEILVLMDGQRLNEPRTGGLSYLVPSIPIANIDRIEFIRGPGAAIYGSNAMMGVINIISRSASKELNVSYGNNSHRQISLLENYSSNTFNADFFTRIEADNGEAFIASDSITGAATTTRDPNRNIDLNLKLQWENTQLNAHHNKSQANGFYVANHISNYYNNSVDSQFSTLTLKHKFTWLNVESWAWLSYSQSSFSQSRQITEIGTKEHLQPLSGDPASQVDSLVRDNERRLQIHNDWEIDQSQSLQFGTELRAFTAPKSLLDLNAGTINHNARILRPESKREVVGAYGQYQSTPFRQSHLTVGLRYDAFSGIGSQLSPRISWIQNIGSNHTLKFLYGKAFRAPSENELHTTNNDVFVGNPNLQPETVASFDLIWLSNWENINTSLGYFENHFKNAIIQTSVDRTLQYLNSNIGDHTKGYEVEIKYQINSQLLLQSTYTYITVKPDSSFRETDHLGSLSVNYSYGPWNTNLITSYNGDRDKALSNDTRETLNNYWQLFGNIRYSFSSQKEVYLKIKNMADKTILSPPSFPRGQDSTPSRGREIIIGATITW